MNRLLLLVLLSLVQETMPVATQAQRPFNVAFAKGTSPVEAAQLAPGIYVTLSDMECGGHMTLVNDSLRPVPHYSDYFSLRPGAFVKSQDTTWVVGDLFVDDVRTNNIEYFGLDSTGAVVSSQSIHLDSYSIDLSRRPFRAFAKKGHQVVCVYTGVVALIDAPAGSPHTMRTYKTYTYGVTSLYFWGDSLVANSSSGVWVVASDFSGSRVLGPTVDRLHVYKDTICFLQRGTQITKLNSTLDAIIQKDFSADISSIQDWYWFAGGVGLLCRDLAGNHVILELDEDLNETSRIPIPFSGAHHLMGDASGWAVYGFFPSLGIRVADAQGHWKPLLHKVELVAAHTRVASTIPLNAERIYVNLETELEVVYTGLDTLHHLDVWGPITGGMNCATFQYYKAYDGLSYVSGDTVRLTEFPTPYQLMEVGAPRDYTYRFTVAYPNHQFQLAESTTWVNSVFQYTARDAAHSLLAQVVAYPNPTTDLLRLTLPPTLPAVAYTVQDLQGRTLATGQARTGTALPTAQLAPGLYVLRLHTPEGAAHCLRFIKQ